MIPNPTYVPEGATDPIYDRPPSKPPPSSSSSSSTSAPTVSALEVSGDGYLDVVAEADDEDAHMTV